MTPTSDVALVRAVEGNFVATWAMLGESAGELRDTGAARWIAAGDHPFLNAVLDTRTDPLPEPAEIEQIATRITELAGSCVWWVQPSAAASRLAEHLTDLGFSPYTGPWPGMGVELDALSPAPALPGLELIRVDGAETLGEYLTAFDASLSPGPGFTAAFRRAASVIGFAQDAPMAHFVVREGGLAVACASYMEGGGAAGLYNVGTVTNARGRGIGAWISSIALLYGRERGHALGVLQAPS
ncbi:MAG: hypothetical protein LC744_03210 [Chloroflexi bacterium]|nr:hypothetical protein [Chloroflexota bacterium]